MRPKASEAAGCLAAHGTLDLLLQSACGVRYRGPVWAEQGCPPDQRPGALPEAQK